MVPAIHRLEALPGSRAARGIGVRRDDRASEAYGRRAARIAEACGVAHRERHAPAAGMFHPGRSRSLQISGGALPAADRVDVGSQARRQRRGSASVCYQLPDYGVGHRVGGARDGRAQRGEHMRSETIAIHGGYEVEPTTKAVAVPIYQTVAYAFDSADHGAALFNLEVEGYRYSRISNPTTAVLERRVSALEGGDKSHCVATGQAAVNYAALNETQMGTHIRPVPPPYRTTYTMLAHLLPP